MLQKLWRVEVLKLKAVINIVKTELKSGDEGEPPKGKTLVGAEYESESSAPKVVFYNFILFTTEDDVFPQFFWTYCLQKGLSVLYVDDISFKEIMPDLDIQSRGSDNSTAPARFMDHPSADILISWSNEPSDLLFKSSISPVSEPPYGKKRAPSEDYELMSEKLLTMITILSKRNLKTGIGGFDIGEFDRNKAENWLAERSLYESLYENGYQGESKTV